MLYLSKLIEAHNSLNLLVDANRISVGEYAEELNCCINLISGVIENIYKTVIIKR